MREIYEILTGLEATAAERVAVRGVSAEERAVLERAVADMEDALAADDLDAWAAADERFHFLLIELSGNKRLKAMVSACWDQAHRVRMITLRLRPKPVSSNEDHANVVAAILRGDAEAAHRLHREHRIQSGKMLVGLLDKHSLSQL